MQNVHDNVLPLRTGGGHSEANGPKEDIFRGVMIQRLGGGQSELGVICRNILKSQAEEKTLRMSEWQSVEDALKTLHGQANQTDPRHEGLAQLIQVVRAIKQGLLGRQAQSPAKFNGRVYVFDLDETLWTYRRKGVVPSILEADAATNDLYFINKVQTVRLLESIKAKGDKICFVTTGGYTHDHVQCHLRKIGFTLPEDSNTSRLIDQKVVGLEHAKDLYGVEPQNVILIDNTLNHIEKAIENGFKGQWAATHVGSQLPQYYLEAIERELATDRLDAMQCPALKRDGLTRTELGNESPVVREKFNTYISDHQGVLSHQGSHYIQEEPNVIDVKTLKKAREHLTTINDLCVGLSLIGIEHIMRMDSDISDATMYSLRSIHSLKHHELIAFLSIMQVSVEQRLACLYCWDNMVNDVCLKHLEELKTKLISEYKSAKERRHPSSAETCVKAGVAGAVVAMANSGHAKSQVCRNIVMESGRTDFGELLKSYSPQLLEHSGGRLAKFLSWLYHMFFYKTEAKKSLCGDESIEFMAPRTAKVLRFAHGVQARTPTDSPSCT